MLYEKLGTAEGLVLPEFVEGKAESRRMLVWRSRLKSGESLISGAVLSKDGHGISMGYMVHHIGYRPNQLALRQLFAICRMIDPYIDEVFPISSTEDRRLLYLLIDAHRTLCYRISASIDPTDQGMLLRRCNEWLEGVKAQV